ncbi:ECF subfamily RNA polymerase sigma-24 factor [Mesorhizobium sp. L-8-10]|uniref:transcriptional regulator n=1 Tax=Mesorhizobium sp. L-8-10 TaxID=2744523 RepID=UPI001925AA3D|nr:transcriptional regulator [Mesorhizobium sp. L-8-10]BCH29566.1 ECF subfamily RNA polymerase sigma-24 factor [Mesorhizobium sp. L-8-10]
MTASLQSLRRPYAELLRQAKRSTRRADEAEDLLQTILLAALEAGRTDLSDIGNRRWLEGALRKRAAFDARSAIRRRRRETLCAPAATVEPAERDVLPTRFVTQLPAALRTTALLALTGHNRQEIAWLQNLSDPALRQRIADIKRRWRAAGGHRFEEIPGLAGALAFGRIRRSLLKLVRREGAFLASHDPDGHIFVIGRSRNPIRRQQE